ncbi:MAG: hypothetical protein ABJB66_03790 [Gemmatimonadaceae bacterium]
MSDISAAYSGTFKRGGDTTINRLNYGAMRIVSRGTWDEPAVGEECIRTLKRLQNKYSLVDRGSRVMLSIPDTSKVAQFEKNLAAANNTLSDEEFRALDIAGNSKGAH